MLYKSFFILLVCAAPALAQEADELPSAPWISPWNGHSLISEENSYAPVALPPPVITSYQNIQVTPSPYAQTECAVAINPLDSQNIIIAEIDYSTDFPHTNGVYSSTDGGNSWVKGIISSDAIASSSGDPWLAFDGNGIAYMCGLSHDNGYALQIHKSTDKGKHWATDGRIFNTDPDYPDEPVLACDLSAGSPYYNSLYAAAVGQQTGALFPGGIKFHYRRAGSQNYSAEKNVSTFQLTQIPHIAVGLNGTIYVSYIGVSDILNLKGSLYFNRSTDGGDTWSGDNLISASCYTDTVNGFPKVGSPINASRIGPTPRITVDTSHGSRRGWLYVCYARPNSADCKTNIDIFLQHSTDDGATWSAPTRVNDGPEGADHLSPAMTVNPDGIIAVVYYDRRDDPNNLLVNAYCAISRDGGATFENVRVSTQSTDPFIGRRESSLSIADYIAIAATRSAVYPVWTDGRKNNGDLDIYTAMIPLSTNAVSPQTPNTAMLEIFPNPVNEKAVIHFNGGESLSDISLYDALGRKVETLFHGFASSEESLEFFPSTLPSGAYHVILNSGSAVITRTLTYIK